MSFFAIFGLKNKYYKNITFILLFYNIIEKELKMTYNLIELYLYNRKIFLLYINFDKSAKEKTSKL